MVGEGGLYDCLTSMRTFALTMNKIFIRAPQIKLLWSWFGFANHLKLIAYFISKEKWVRQRVLHPTPHPKATHAHLPIPMPITRLKPSECLKHKAGQMWVANMMVLRERGVGYGRKWDSASIRICLGVADLDVFVKIPHTKIIRVHFFFPWLIGKLVLVSGHFGQNLGRFWEKAWAVLGQKREQIRTSVLRTICTIVCSGHFLRLTRNGF